MKELQPIFEKLYYISIYTPVLALLLGLIYWRKISLIYKVILIKVLVSLTLPNLGNWLAANKINNHFLFYLSPCIDIIVMSFVFGKLINKPWLNKTLWIAISAFLCAFTYDFFFVKERNFMSSYLTSIEGIVVILLLLYYFFTLIYEKQELYLKRNGMFWIGLGYLLTNVLSLLYTFFGTTLAKNMPDLFEFVEYAVFPIFSITGDILIAYGIFIASKQRKFL